MADLLVERAVAKGLVSRWWENGHAANVESVEVGRLGRLAIHEGPWIILSQRREGRESMHKVVHRRSGESERC